MKKTIALSVAILAAFILKAQKLEVGFGFGSGSVYMVENLNKTAGTDFGAPLSFYADLTLRMPDSYFDLKLRGQYIYSNIGPLKTNYTLPYLVDDITSMSFYLLLEHINTEKKWAFGYSVGAGYSNEYSTRFPGSFSLNDDQQEKHFINLYLSGIASLKTSEHITLTLEPAFIWNDIPGTLIGNWGAAGEDINLLVQLGFRYRFK